MYKFMFKKNAKGTLTLIYEGYYKLGGPGYTFTFCLEKPVDKEVKKTDYF